MKTLLKYIDWIDKNNKWSWKDIIIDLIVLGIIGIIGTGLFLFI